MNEDFRRESKAVKNGVLFRFGAKLSESLDLISGICSGDHLFSDMVDSAPPEFKRK